MIELAWWGYLIGIIAGVFFGVFIGCIAYFGFNKWQESRIKKQLPVDLKDKKAVSSFITENLNKKDGLTLDAGPSTKFDAKEVEEDDRRKTEQYREFEKLRRLAQAKPAKSTSATASGKPSIPTGSTGKPESGNAGNKAADTVTRADKGIKLD